MHICLIAHGDAPWTEHYVRIFRSCGHRVSVLSFSPKSVEGAEFHYVGPRRFSSRKNPKWAYLFYTPRVRRLLQALRPNVLLATYFRSNGLVASIVKNAPLVVSTRGVDQSFPLGFLGRALTRWICTRADYIHASSQELADSLTSLGVSSGKIAAIPVGTFPELFYPPSGTRSPGPPRIICTRKHHPIYDNGVIIEALARLRAQDFEFFCTFVGTGTSLDKTIMAARAHGIEQYVEFLGEVPHRHLPSLLRQADIYVSASRADGTSSSLLEAISTCLVPVVSDIPANRTWLSHEESGFLFPVGNPQACADGIAWAWKAREQIGPTLDDNRALVITRGDCQGNTLRLEKILKTVALAQIDGG